MIGTPEEIRVDLSVFTEEAVLKAAYWFTGRAYISLRKSDGEMLVTLSAKVPGLEPGQLSGDFQNAVLDQRLRTIVSSETAAVRDLIMAHALSRSTLLRPDLENDQPQNHG